MIKSFAGILGISVGIFSTLKVVEGNPDFKHTDINFQEFVNQVKEKDKMFTELINKVLREISDN